MSQDQHLEAFGDEDTADPYDGDSDFADEHADTTVDRTITADDDNDEAESPGGWSGMDRDGPP
jgi:hypothetical protein